MKDIIDSENIDMRCNMCNWEGKRNKCIDWGEEYDPICPECEGVCQEIDEFNLKDE